MQYFWSTAQIDWDAITGVEDSLVKGNLIGNYIQINETRCPTTTSCRGCDPRFCWNPRMCQKFETGVNAFGNFYF